MAQIDGFFNEPGSSNWDALGPQRLRLQNHVDISVHWFRGQRWYVLSDSARRQSVRINAKAFAFVGALDGSRSVLQLWQALNGDAAEGSERGYRREEITELCRQLIQLQLVEAAWQPHHQDLAEAGQVQKLSVWQNPLFIRLPLFDPDPLLKKLLPPLRPLLNRFSLLAALLAAVFALLLAGLYQTQLRQAIGIGQHYIEANWWSLLLAFALLKLVHEFAHGLVLKHFGGNSHEMGISFMVFMPIPYVEASSAWSISSKRRRMAISAAGIIAELALASLAFYFWLLVDDSLFANFLLNIAIIGTVSTLLFNANPLLRFDGHYLLEDYLEIPNLYQRSQAYLSERLKQLLFGLPVAGDYRADEKLTLLVFAIGALAYRLVLSLMIVLYLLDSFAYIGLILGAFLVFNQLLKPLYKLLGFIAGNRQLRSRPLAQWLPLLLGSSALIGVLALLPLPRYINAQGVLWLPEDARLVAPHDGRVEQLHVDLGQRVEPGRKLLGLVSPDLQRDIAINRAELAEQRANYFSLMRESNAAKAQARARLQALTDSLAERRALLQEMQLASGGAGELVGADPFELRGRYVRKGQTLAYVLGAASPSVKAVIDQRQLALIKNQLRGVELRLASRLQQAQVAELLRIWPAPSRQLPAAALGLAGGGDVLTRPSSGGAEETLEEVYWLDLASQNLPDRIGERVYLRFELTPAPLLSQFGQFLQQLFVNRLFNL